MFSVSKSFSFCYAHRLLNDPGKCKNLHGHTGRVVVSLNSKDTNEIGMVCHFDRLKETIGKWINDNLDHKTILSKSDPIAGYLNKNGEKVFEMNQNPTAENIAKLIYDKSVELGLKLSKVEVWESDSASAIYEA